MDRSGRRALPRVNGWRASVEVLIQDLPPITETVWFCEGLSRGVLGQSGWFEGFAIRFHNWPQARLGRKFQFFLPTR